jgi:hypothetical protein
MEIIVDNWQQVSAMVLVLCTIVLGVLNGRTIKAAGANSEAVARVREIAEAVKADTESARAHFDEVVGRLPKRRAKRTTGEGEGS